MIFYDDLKLPFYQRRNTKRYKDVEKFIKDDAIEIDGKKHYSISDIIAHSLGSAIGQQINNDHGNIFRSRSCGSPFVSGQQKEDTGTNLRIRKAGDVVSMFDNGIINLNRSSLNPFDNHSYADIANVKHKAGNEPITKEEFMEQFIFSYVLLIMFHPKATSYEQMEKPKKEKKLKQNAYEEIRKLVEDNEGNDIVKEVKGKKKQQPENTYRFKLFD